jgi:hypothetical protein
VLGFPDAANRAGFQSIDPKWFYGKQLTRRCRFFAAHGMPARRDPVQLVETWNIFSMMAADRCSWSPSSHTGFRESDAGGYELAREHSKVDRRYF